MAVSLALLVVLLAAAFEAAAASGRTLLMTSSCFLALIGEIGAFQLSNEGEELLFNLLLQAELSWTVVRIFFFRAFLVTDAGECFGWSGNPFKQR